MSESSRRVWVPAAVAPFRTPLDLSLRSNGVSIVRAAWIRFEDRLSERILYL